MFLIADSTVIAFSYLPAMSFLAPDLLPPCQSFHATTPIAGGANQPFQPRLAEPFIIIRKARERGGDDGRMRSKNTTNPCMLRVPAGHFGLFSDLN